jgi:hypothetical protein
MPLRRNNSPHLYYNCSLTQIPSSLPLLSLHLVSRRHYTGAQHVTKKFDSSLCFSSSLYYKSSSATTTTTSSSGSLVQHWIPGVGTRHRRETSLCVTKRERYIVSFIYQHWASGAMGHRRRGFS